GAAPPARALDALGVVAALAAQAAREKVYLELAAAAGDDLGAELRLAGVAQVFALHGEVGPRLGRVGVDLVLGLALDLAFLLAVRPGREGQGQEKTEVEEFAEGQRERDPACASWSGGDGAAASSWGATR